MKRKFAAILTLMMVVCLMMTACGGGGGTPQEQLASYIEKNGTKDGEVYTYVYEAGATIIKEQSPMGDMGNDSDKMETTEECVISYDGNAFYIETVDKEVSFNGITMDRGVVLNITEGTADYHNSLIYNGMDMGGTMEVQIPVSIYTAADMPTINSSDFASGSAVTDAMKEAMQQYVNLTIDCFSAFAEQELGLTVADFGYEAYVPAK